MGGPDLRALPLFLAAVLGLACETGDRDIRLGRLAAERRALEATFDHLEDRLMANQARVRFWREMQARHESVSAIACASQEGHALEMALRAGPRAPVHASRVASLGSAAAVERVPAAAGRGGGSR